MTRPLVSACLIVRDEERHLDRCLRSLEGVVDEVVVVDTGSSDGTVAIAERHGATVLPFAWCDDFSAARNASISAAAGEWLFWLDADEEVVEASPGALRRLCRRPEKPEGWMITCRNLVNDQGEIGTVIKQWRLFRNQLGLRFVNRIHEHLQQADGSTTAYLLFQEEVSIRHWGYIPREGITERKRERNLRLLEMAIADDPNDPFHHYNHGKQLLGAQRPGEALEALNRAVALWQAQGRPAHIYAGNLLALAMEAAFEAGQYQRILDLEALAPPEMRTAELLYQAGLACWRLGRPADAVPRLERACQDPALASAIEGDPSTSTWRPLAALAQIFLEQGDAERAHAYALRAHACQPVLPNLLHALCVTSATLRRYDESLGYARQILELDCYAGYQAQARRLMLNIGQGLARPDLVLEALAGPADGIAAAQAVLLRAEGHAALGDTQAAYDELDAGCRAFPTDTPLRLALAQLLEGQGLLPEATNVLAAALDQPDTPPALYQRLALLLSRQGRLEDAANALELAGRRAVEPVAAAK